MGISPKYILYAVIIFVVQVLVFHEIFQGTYFESYFDIMIYPLMIFILPVRTSSSLVVVIAFVFGLLIDMFYNSPGVHTSALVLCAFARRIILNTFEPRGGYRTDDTPLNVKSTDYWYLTYSASLLFIHLFMYYLVSFFSLTFTWDILLKTVVSFVVSMVLISLHALAWRALN